MKKHILYLLLLSSFTLFFSGCKKNSNGNGTNNGGYINATVDGVQYNCSVPNGTPSSYSGTWGAAYYCNSAQLPNYEFGIEITSYATLNSVHLPYTFTNNYTAPGIEMFFYYNQATSPTQTGYYCNNWAMDLTATITSISNNTIQGTFSGSCYPSKTLQSGTFSIPYNP
jgi:hypothetical protein